MLVGLALLAAFLLYAVPKANPTVQMVWDHLLLILKNIPQQA